MRLPSVQLSFASPISRPPGPRGSVWQSQLREAQLAVSSQLAGCMEPQRDSRLHEVRRRAPLDGAVAPEDPAPFVPERRFGRSTPAIVPNLRHVRACAWSCSARPGTRDRTAPTTARSRRLRRSLPSRSVLNTGEYTNACDSARTRQAHGMPRVFSACESVNHGVHGVHGGTQNHGRIFLSGLYFTYLPRTYR
jgi:hypothetical protein